MPFTVTMRDAHRRGHDLAIKVAAGAAATLGAAAMLLGSAGPAAAAQPSGARAAALPTCSPGHVRTPTIGKTGSTINGYGGFFDCSGRPYATIRLERLRAFGWQTVGTEYYGLFHYDRSVGYYCAGTGTFTYRTLMFGRTVGGTPWTRKSREMRTTC